MRARQPDIHISTQSMKRAYISTSMRRSNWIRVRPLEVSDFRFIQRLASRKPSFTVPPPYVLWLLKQTNSSSCIVAEHAKLGPVGYLLSLLVATPRENVLYVWQLAASESGLSEGGIHELLLTLRSFIRRKRVRKVRFTAMPQSPELRAIRRYAYSLFGTELRSQEIVPASVSRGEREFVVRVK
jgi:hypothetical protein